MIKGGSLKILFLRDPAILELEGSRKIFPRSLAIPYGVVGTAEHAVSGTELWIQFDGPFKKRNGFRALSGAVEDKPGAVGL